MTRFRVPELDDKPHPLPPPDQLAPGSPLDLAGDAPYQARAAYMVQTQQGLTQTYNQLKDPENTDPAIATLRDLHLAPDRAVLAAYGWSNLDPPQRSQADHREGLPIGPHILAYASRSTCSLPQWHCRWLTL